MRIRKYLGPQRLFLWHSLQAILCLALLFSGFGMYYADAGRWVMDFNTFHEIHKFAGISASVAYVLLFIPYHLESNHDRVHHWWRLVLHHSRTIEKTKHVVVIKFKDIVSTRYVVVMFLLFPIMISTGIMMLFPSIFMKYIAGVNLYEVLLVVHITGSVLILLFTAIHLFVVLIDKKKANWIHGFLKFWYKL